MAITLLFLLASAALAVDVSGFYETARTDQTTADLACLAGVPYLPEAAATARAAAAENVQRNFPSLASASATTAGCTLTLTDGAGNTALITSPVGSDSAKMQVVITETDVATFGRVIGANQVPVTQQAYCKVFAGGGSDVPFGAMPGGWDGQLQDNNPCGTNSGNCGRLYVPRDDVNGAGPQTEENIASGLDRTLKPGLWPSLVGCGAISAGGNCNVVETNTGVNAAALGQGFRRRLQDTAGASQMFTYGGNQYNADTPAQILGGAPTTSLPPSAARLRPGGRSGSTACGGPSNVSNHYYWNDVIAKCDSPRLISFPIVSDGPDMVEGRLLQRQAVPGMAEWQQVHAGGRPLQRDPRQSERARGLHRRRKPQGGRLGRSCGSARTPGALGLTDRRPPTPRMRSRHTDS